MQLKDIVGDGGWKNKSVYHIKKNNITTQETLPPLQRSGLVNYDAHKNGMLYSN